MSKVEGIKSFYWYTFFSFLAFTLPIYTLLFLSVGISFSELAIIIIGFNIATVLFEIPSGMVADKYGRKTTLMLSKIFFIIGIGLIAFFPNYYIFILGWSICGIAYSFNSGADTAYLYDTLKDKNKEDEYKRINGKVFAIRSFAMGFASPIGGFVADHYGLVTPFFLLLISSILALTTVFFFKEPKSGKVKEDKSYAMLFGTAAKKILEDKIVLIVVMLYSVIFTMIVSGHYYTQAYLQDILSLDLKYFGVLYALLLFLTALASYYAHKLDKIWGVKLTFGLIIAAVSFDFFTKYAFPILPVFIFASALNNFSYGLLVPLFNDIVNKRIDSFNRATVISLASFISGAFIFTLNPFFGYISDKFGILRLYLTLSGIVFIISLVLMIFLNVYMKKPILKEVRGVSND